MPYGYPSGAALRQQLINERLFRHIVEKGVLSANDVQAFCEVFRYSGMASIDAFLSRRGSDTTETNGATFEAVGKVGIALALREYASFGGLFHRWIDAAANRIDGDDNWYEYLWSRLTDGVAKNGIAQFGDNQLTIITFNYDTSLEQYLFTALKNSYGLSDKIALELLQKIPIIHMYGRLMFDRSDATPSQTLYGMGGKELITLDAMRFRVIDEMRVDDGDLRKTCFQHFLYARRIVFLGFSFDLVNVNRLQIANAIHERYERQFKNNSDRAPILHCTTLGLEKHERERVHSSIFGGITQVSSEYGGLASHYFESTKASILEAAEFKSLRLLRSSGVLA